MKALKIIFLITVLFSLNGCNNDDDTSKKNGTLAINFTHNWDDVEVSASDLNDLKFTTANNDLISIVKLRYLISNIILQNSEGENIELDGYFLVDLNNNNLTGSIANVPAGNYTNISFTFGFNEEDNIDGAYLDLNSTLWNWPEMLGGGYHFMQFEGRYNTNSDESPFAYHMGTARVDIGQFEQNFFNTSIGNLTLNNNSTIEIKMNIAQWFKNPNTWDLNTLNIDLMPNYEAQKMMNQNGLSVFSVSIINE